MEVLLASRPQRPGRDGLAGVGDRLHQAQDRRAGLVALDSKEQALGVQPQVQPLLHVVLEQLGRLLRLAGTALADAVDELAQLLLDLPGGESPLHVAPEQGEEVIAAAAHEPVEGRLGLRRGLLDEKVHRVGLRGGVGGHGVGLGLVAHELPLRLC